MDVPGKTPDEILDAFRDGHDHSGARQASVLDRLISRFPAEVLRASLARRFHRLGGPDGEIVLRIVETLATPELLERLADGLLVQPDLPAERAWDALAVLDGAGILERHDELLDRWDELNELMDDTSLDALAEQLAEEPEGSWIALHGLNAVEPEVRSEILAGLEDFPTTPGLVQFFRLLCYAHDPITRESAIEGLFVRSPQDPSVETALVDLSVHHPDQALRTRAGQRLSAKSSAGRDLMLVTCPRRVPGPHFVSAVDGEGRATLILSAKGPAEWSGAAFLCHVERGILDVIGHSDQTPDIVRLLIEDDNITTGNEPVECSPEVAEALLAGCHLLCGPGTNLALRYWIERVIGEGFQPRPFADRFGDFNPASVPFEELSWRVDDLLDACPDWVDRSPLTYDLAEEMTLRLGGDPLDPRRDAGAYRYLFEHRIAARLELFRRMLLWNAAAWHASDRIDLGQTALALAWQLADPQHAVPSHPFTVAYTTRSLHAAQKALKEGLDPRRY